MEKDFSEFEALWDESKSVSPAMAALERSFGTAKLDENLGRVRSYLTR